jgi:multidrug resistance efflux pump
MLTTEQIDRSKVRSERFQTDALEAHSSPITQHFVELRSDQRKAPSIARKLTKAFVAFLPATRNQRIRWGLFALLPIVLIAGAFWYVASGQIMSTDDAYVEADKVGISTDVSGIVQDVDVTDHQHVTAGQVLYRLDPRQFQIALDNAKANLAQTALAIDSMKRDYQRMLSDVDAQQAQVALG